MSNGYFKLVKAVGGFGVMLVPPTDGGEEIKMLELTTYLERAQVPYDISNIKKLIGEHTKSVCFLDRKDCPAINEQYQLTVSEDSMSVSVRFIPASETGERISFDEFIKDLRYRNITSGLQMDVLQDHFQSDGIYGTDLIVAKGREPRHGSDARIEYYFNTDVHAQPTMRDDGSVDFFNLNVINHCKAGDMLARIVPADEGEYGVNVMGARIKPRDVKRVTLKFGHNIELSEDKLSIFSKVNGHVVLVEDKVFVSDVFEVENVDISTGNIEFEGSVQVNGNVSSNYVVKANGNVIINGVVEGAHIEAGGNIIIARGMNGMSKGTLKAGGNIVAKFLESATAEAEGYVSTESILHSRVVAGTEIVVSGKRGFITGGHVQAAQKVEVKNLGAVMGTSTIVEVGVSPQVKQQYIQLQKDITEIVQEIKAAQPVLTNFAEKRAKGARFNEEQLAFVKQKAVLIETKKKELAQKNAMMKSMQEIFNPAQKACVKITGEVYPGTTIIIGDVSTNIESSYKYCRFEKIAGEVKMAPL